MPALDPWTSSTAYDRGATGTSAFMAKVYRWMSAGLAITGLFAWGVYQSPGFREVVWTNPFVAWGLLIAQLVLVGFFGAAVRRASVGTVAAMFVGYAALLGVSLSAIFVAYRGPSIAQAFFVTGGTFFAMSAYGTVTKRDLSSFGHFLFMGLIGIVLGGLVNVFVGSSALSFVLSCMGVVVFTGLTAWHTQQIRAYAQSGDDRLALAGALSLYLDFINLFLILLRFFGGDERRR